MRSGCVTVVLVLVLAGCGSSELDAARSYATAHYASGHTHVLRASAVDPRPRGPANPGIGPPLPKRCIRVVVGSASCTREDVALYLRHPFLSGWKVWAYDVLSVDTRCR